MPDDAEAMRRLQQRLSSLTPDQRAVLERGIGGRIPATAAPVGTRTAASAAAAPGRRSRRDSSTMDFGLFFFSGSGSTERADKYALLLDCARYADASGFSAVWVPERHFVDFGGLYPNPSVLAAALAMVTERIDIRAGSVVVPLHHPVRIAEEWAVVDNLSGGRVAISCASGWHPNDFLLAPGDGPGRYEQRKDDMFAGIETLRRLWAGERVALGQPDGGEVMVRSLPRPLQRSLPIWISSQGSAETFVRAGHTRANVLTGLVGQRLTDLAGKIEAYRRARRERDGDAGRGHVTAMVHTFLGPSTERVKEVVRAPLIGYLETFLSQQGGADSPFNQLGDADREVMLSSAFERYFDTIALLGTPDKCESLIEDLVDIGVDEVACLVDFGLDDDQVLGGLRHLAELAGRYRRRTEGAPR